MSVICAMVKWAGLLLVCAVVSGLLGLLAWEGGGGTIRFKLLFKLLLRQLTHVELEPGLTPCTALQFMIPDL